MCNCILLQELSAKVQCIKGCADTIGWTAEIEGCIGGCTGGAPAAAPPAAPPAANDETPAAPPAAAAAAPAAPPAADAENQVDVVNVDTVVETAETITETKDVVVDEKIVETIRCSCPR